jgi:hypothetical protein
MPVAKAEQAAREKAEKPAFMPVKTPGEIKTEEKVRKERYRAFEIASRRREEFYGVAVSRIGFVLVSSFYE